MRETSLLRTPSEPAHIQLYNGIIHYNGRLTARMPGQYDTIIGDGSAFGTEAYGKMRPDKPEMELLNAIYELREFPSMLRQRFLDRGINSIGDYWLALKFGWEPLLRDTGLFVLTQINMQKRLAQLIRDSGRPIKRRIKLRDESYASGRLEWLDWGAFEQSFHSGFYQWQPGCHAYIRTNDRVWASARFRYWLPEGPRDVVWKAKMMAAIFGLYPSPKVVWNALPWTWLIDWFGNVGNILSNMSNTGLVERLAADYFYVMREQVQWTQISSHCDFNARGSNAPIRLSAQSSRTDTLKTRVRGDPFGWDTPENSLSGMQWSILGALGMSRLR
nr:MAG: hypothetical protein 1 [Leviviridae sp.]